MSKEELEKEAEVWLNKWELCNKCENKVNCISNFSYCKKVVLQSYLASAEPREKRIAELETQIEQMKCCENCGWFYFQQHWRESKEINESRMFHCGTCGNKKNWKLKEVKEND